MDALVFLLAMALVGFVAFLSHTKMFSALL